MCWVSQAIANFGFIVHRRDGVIFHPHILHNDGCYGLDDDDNWTSKIYEMDSSAIAAAQTEGVIKLRVSKEDESQCVMSTNQDGCTHSACHSPDEEVHVWKQEGKYCDSGCFLSSWESCPKST